MNDEKIHTRTHTHQSVHNVCDHWSREFHLRPVSLFRNNSIRAELRYYFINPVSSVNVFVCYKLTERGSLLRVEGRGYFVCERRKASKPSENSDGI